MRFSPLLLTAGLSSALCPFKRGDHDIDEDKVAELFAQVNHHLPDEPASAKEKRDFPFDAEQQLIDVSGVHAWQAPGPNDIRGPCPGLNALANHGYYPRSGVVGLLQGATGVDEVYGLAPSFGIPLSLYAVLIDGDPLTQTWSIGGPPDRVIDLPILGPGNGLSGSHNKYESDASPGRGDFYLYDGDVESLRVETFQALYDLAKDDDVPNYNLDVITKHREYTLNLSKETNPYFFMAPFAGFAVSNAAHTFIPALMSNHSEEYPNGILDKETLKQFFSITEDDDGTLTYTKGHERIPENWYRRPKGVLYGYSPVSFATDLLQMAETVPDVVAIGGNTGEVNTFAGVNLGDITGGAYNLADLTDPSKFSCFFYQLILVVVPDIVRSRFLGGVIGIALGLLSDTLGPFIDPECAKIANFNDDFGQFPGAGLGDD